MPIIGNHVKLEAGEQHRDRVRMFYRGILGCAELPAPMPNADLFRMPDGFVLGVFYSPAEQARTDEQCLAGTWLEIMTPDVDGLIGKLRQFGVKEIEYWDKNHFYFHSPGGPVFRIAPEAERGSQS